MNKILEEFFETHYVKDAEGTLIDAQMSAIEYAEGMCLYNLVRQKSAQETLEIGLAYGISALFICQAHRDNGVGHHIAIDPEETTNWNSIGLLNIDRACLNEYFSFIEACSYEVLPKFLEHRHLVDLVLIDGNHTFDYTLVDFFYSDLILKTGGYILFHDVWMPSVRKVLRYVLNNRNYRLAPEMLWNPGPAWKRAWYFFTEVPARSIRTKLAGKYFLANPLDLLDVYSTFYLAFRGNLKYWVVQKTGNDQRTWDFHNAF
jgi:predicted O-methyltransferase YrrM